MIITSLLDQDFYKFSMGQVVLRHFPDYQVSYQFKCRNHDIQWTTAMVDDMQAELRAFCNLRFTPDELAYLGTIRFLKPWYLDFLKLYQPDYAYLSVKLDGDLQIEVTGPWYLTIYFEMPILAIVNEVYFRHTSNFNALVDAGRQRLAQKIALAKAEGFHFSDFGTRRRYSAAWHGEVVKTLAREFVGGSKAILMGTSNVLLAKQNALTPIGTMAHELIQAGQAANNVTLANSQVFMLQTWVDFYRGDLGIALTDTLGLEKFLQDFDLYFAKLYDGVRHDSGDPLHWAQRILAHYRKLGIDPRTKTLVFSDGLDFPKAAQLWRELKGQAHISFGIGTNLTNDFPGITPLQIVIKIVRCNGRPVAKLSDSPGKTICQDNAFLTYLRSVI